jgi:hypothetical protein
MAQIATSCGVTPTTIYRTIRTIRTDRATTPEPSPG